MDKTERVEKLENILKKIFLRAFPKLEKACQGCGIISSLLLIAKSAELEKTNQEYKSLLEEYKQLQS